MAQPIPPGFSINSTPAHSNQRMYMPPPNTVAPPPDSQAPHYPPYPGANPMTTQPFSAPNYNQQPPQSQYWINPIFQTFLDNASSFHVKQHVQLLEAVLHFETGNKYTVKDQMGNKVFYVGEESNECCKHFIGAKRAFSLRVQDARGQDILRFERPYNCCFQTMTVYTSNGQTLGYIEENLGCSPYFTLKNAANHPVLRIQAPLCAWFFSYINAAFKLETLEGVPIGSITKEWAGLLRELYTDADFFSITFPPDLDSSVKALCLGALFLIDYMYFERSRG